jgi:putative effector of murein hydrolase
MVLYRSLIVILVLLWSSSITAYAVLPNAVLLLPTKQRQQNNQRLLLSRYDRYPHPNKPTTGTKPSSLSSTIDSSNDINSNKSTNSFLRPIRTIQNLLKSNDIISIFSTILFISIDVLFRKLFKLYNISFPSSLGACGILFISLLIVPNTISKNMMVPLLQPGSTLLSKWLPVFFVPSLITLPLTDNVGNTMEILKIFSIIITGFLFTLLTTSYSVLFVRYIKNLNPTTNTYNTSSTTSTSTTTTTSAKTNTDAITTVTKNNVSTPSTNVKPFSDVLMNILYSCTVVTGIGAMSSMVLTKQLNTIITSLFLLSTTLCTFVFGSRLSTTIKKVIHPLVTCTSFTWMMIASLAVLIPHQYSTSNAFHFLLKIYKTGHIPSTSSSLLPTISAGNVLLFLLGPAVVSLAVSMYEKRELMKQNIIELIMAITTSTLGGLYGTAYAVRCINIASPYLRLSLLSRNITSPLAMAIATILGADISLAVSMVVVTGLIGANFGAFLLNMFRIYDPVARGLGIGAAAHGLGTAAFVNEKDAFPFAAISMALTASAATIAVSIPVIRKSLLQLALGA